jgi:hypothetical protein
LGAGIQKLTPGFERQRIRQFAPFRLCHSPFGRRRFRVRGIGALQGGLGQHALRPYLRYYGTAVAQSLIRSEDLALKPLNSFPVARFARLEPLLLSRPSFMTMDSSLLLSSSDTEWRISQVNFQRFERSILARERLYLVFL